jgi:hypothetical protein
MLGDEKAEDKRRCRKEYRRDCATAKGRRFGITDEMEHGAIQIHSNQNSQGALLLTGRNGVGAIIPA